MKNIFGLILVVLTFSSQSFALVQELALCTTSDGHFTISVTDNQGIGPVRTPHVSASVTDAAGNAVATYKAEEFHGAQSVSFGRRKYQDTETSGHEFLLEAPSTNFRHYSLYVEMNVGKNSGNISDDNLSCSLFGGALTKKP